MTKRRPAEANEERLSVKVTTGIKRVSLFRSGN
jgi:hypothetical protein